MVCKTPYSAILVSYSAPGASLKSNNMSFECASSKKNAILLFLIANQTQGTTVQKLVVARKTCSALKATAGRRLLRALTYTVDALLAGK